MTVDPPRNGEGNRGAQRRGGGASPHVPPIVESARKLRRQMTYPEVLLWQRLRGSPSGIRFRRQHPISLDYAADFYCPAARLVIEVDGEIHSQPGVITGDAFRDEFFRSRGLTVVRVPAREVLRDADQAAAALFALAERPLHPRRKSGGGPPPQQAGEDQG